FFSSRRRHTRFSRDWSSDVCSSDLSNPLQHRLSHRTTTLALGCHNEACTFQRREVIRYTAVLTFFERAKRRCCRDLTKYLGDRVGEHRLPVFACAPQNHETLFRSLAGSP